MASVLLQRCLHTSLLVLILMTITSTTSVRRKREAGGGSPDSPCYRSGGRIWVRDPHNCSRYVVCGFGSTAASMKCPASLVWSVQVKNCVPRGSRWDDCVEAEGGGGPDGGVSEGGSEGAAREPAASKRRRYRPARRHRNRPSRSEFRQRNGRMDTNFQNELETRREHKHTDRPDHRSSERRWHSDRTTGDNRQGHTEWQGTENSNWEDGNGRITNTNTNREFHYYENTRRRSSPIRRQNDDSPKRVSIGTEEYAKGDADDSETTGQMIHASRSAPHKSNQENEEWEATFPVGGSFFTESSLSMQSSSRQRSRWTRRRKSNMPVHDVERLEQTAALGTRAADGSKLSTNPVHGVDKWEPAAGLVSPTPKIVWWEPSTTAPAPRDDRWQRTTHANSWWDSTEASTTQASREIPITTIRSPFAKWRTTRRRKIVENWYEEHSRRHHSKRVKPKYGDGNWWGKTTSWSLWTSTRPTTYAPSTIRPWWAPGYGDRLPWLMPASTWVPQHQRSSPSTTTTTTTTPTPTTTSTTTTTPTTTTTTTTSTTTTPPPPPIKSTTSWYQRTDYAGDNVETHTTGRDYPVSVTPSGIWTPFPPHDHDYDYLYDSDKDSSEDGNIWDKLGETTPGKRKSEVGRQQTTDPVYDYDENGWRQVNSTSKYYPECGVAITNMIVGGLPAAEGRWPWVVSLRLTWAQRHVCGGTLVHPQWIVTAAHCVFGSQFEDASDWRAVFGSKQPTLTSDVKSHRKIDLIVRHPEFVNGGNYPNDIAMMRLEEPVDVSGFNIRHACLPSRDHPFLSDSECWIMGWGETKGLEEQSVLQELDAKIRRNHACAARWGWKRILNSHVCVGNGDGGACNGDSGGPLVCLRDGYYFLVGVTSWGVSGCQTTGYPSVFSRVSFYDKWIEGVIQTYSTFEFPLQQPR